MVADDGGVLGALVFAYCRYVTLFAAAFPLTAALALLNNMIEIRTDAYKLLQVLLCYMLLLHTLPAPSPRPPVFLPARPSHACTRARKHTHTHTHTHTPGNAAAIAEAGSGHWHVDGHPGHHRHLLHPHQLCARWLHIPWALLLLSQHDVSGACVDHPHLRALTALVQGCAGRSAQLPAQGGPCSSPHLFVARSSCPTPPLWLCPRSHLVSVPLCLCPLASVSSSQTHVLTTNTHTPLTTNTHTHHTRGRRCRRTSGGAI